MGLAEAAPRKRELDGDSAEQPRPHAPWEALALNEVNQHEPSSLTVEVGLPFASQDSKLLIHRSRL
jgi:hypothetical protein